MKKIVCKNYTLYQNDEGQIHRIDGPAFEDLEYPKCNRWYYKGKEIFCSTQEEFYKIIKLKAFW